VGLPGGQGLPRDAAVQALAEEYGAAWDAHWRQRMFLPSRGDHGAYGVPDGKGEMLQSLTTNFAALRARVERDAKAALKLEGKLQVVTAGYVGRAKQFEQVRRVRACFQTTSGRGVGSRPLLQSTPIFLCRRRCRRWSCAGSAR